MSLSQPEDQAGNPLHFTIAALQCHIQPELIKAITLSYQTIDAPGNGQDSFGPRQPGGITSHLLYNGITRL